MSNLTGNVDWITATSNNDRIGALWYSQYCNYKASLGKQGEVFERTFSNGFYSGLRVEGLQWGYSDRLGYILIASGQTAREMWQYMRPSKHKITRLDLCVDWLLTEPKTIAKDGYDHLMEFGPKIVEKFTYFTNGDGGDTLYLGSRQSPQYGRIYDKGIESGHAPKGHLWRYEVEYKKPMSGYVAENLMMFQQSGLADTIAKMVISWFAERNVPSRPSIEMGTRVPIFVEERVTTADKKLAWLRGQVAPTVSRLIEAGLGKEVLRCLLLDERQVREILDMEEGF